MQTYGRLNCELAEKAMNSLPLGKVFSARTLMQEVSLEVILKVVFGIYQGERFRTLKALIVQLTDSLQSPLIAGLLFFPLEPGTRLYGCIYLTHQRQDLYPEPQAFKPERFLERQFSPYEFLPFGGGARRCIGEALAQFEMKLILATMLSRYQLALAEQAPERPQRRGVILAPANGVRMILQGLVPNQP